MTLPNEEYPAPQQSVGTTGENPYIGTTQKDPLINRGLQHWQYIGIIALAISAIAFVRVLSPKAEHAIFFALGLTAVLIIFFFTS